MAVFLTLALQLQFFSFAVLGIERRASHRASTQCTTELYYLPCNYFLIIVFMYLEALSLLT
jgi:hypothetical protein